MKKILIFSTIILFSSLSIAKNKDQLKRKGNFFSFLFYNTPQLESEDSSSNTFLRNVLNSKIIACAQEERFTRIKHTPDFPINSIKYCLEETGLSLSELDGETGLFPFMLSTQKKEGIII